MKVIIVLVIILCKISQNFVQSNDSVNGNVGDVGEPLFLTPYIQSGNITEAKRLSRVEALPNAPNIMSFSGFLTVNKQYNSNTFFWFFPALNNNSKAPVILWLTGGPGGSFLADNFVCIGPIEVMRKDLKPELREYSWVQEFSLLFIDQIGCGFSFTDDEAGYARNQSDVARDLYEAIQQFFTLFSEQLNNDFYIIGSSYAGKYVPAISHKIHSEGLNANISLKGIAIGDGWSDPNTQFAYGDYMFQIGLIDQKQRNYVKNEEKKAIEYINKKQYMNAFHVWDNLLLGVLNNDSFYLKDVTGLTQADNYLLTKNPENWSYFTDYVELNATRKAIHVGNRTNSDKPIVTQESKALMYLIPDIMKSVKPWVETLLDNYKVMIYSGQLDITVGTTATEHYIRNLNWSQSESYRKADRIVWKVTPSDREVAGYVRQVDKFYQVVVRNAGHVVPYDQPRRAFDMITRFIKNLSFN